MRLGRIAHDPARVAQVPHHVMGDSPIPPSWASPAGFTPTLADNLTLPTCTVAGLANSARLYMLHSGWDLVQDDDLILELYASIAGCAATPAAIAMTDGLVMLDVLERAQKSGFQIAPDTVLIPEFRQIDGTLGALEDAVARYGSIYLGVDLDSEDVSGDVGAPWVAHPLGNLVGGHCIVLDGYAPETAATWGVNKQAPMDWLQPRLREAYAVVWSL